MANFELLISEAKFETANETVGMLNEATKAVAYRQQQEFSDRLLGALSIYLAPEIMEHCLNQTFESMNLKRKVA